MILRGTSAADRLRGGTAGDQLSGLDGDDVLRGGGGRDTLTGGAGSDTLVGDAGADRLDGGGGRDTLVFRPGLGGIDTVIGGGGIDTLLIRLTAAQAASTTILAAIDALRANLADAQAAAVLGLQLNGVEQLQVAIDPVLPRISLAAVASGVGGFAIRGEAARDWAGVAVATTPLGDLNGDGRADVLLGAFQNDAGGDDAGAAYVVFGKADGTVVELGDVAAGIGGFKVIGANPGDRAGRAPAVIGDLNGDGRAELLIGATEDGFGTGVINVVFGKADTAPVDLGDIANGIGGFVIRGELPLGLVGRSVAGIGDWNGDGRPDLLVGAPDAGAGQAYVVFAPAGTAPIDLADVALGRGGFVLRGDADGDSTGILVAAAGDVNRDGRGDLLIGAPEGDRAYVVFGGDTAPPDLAAVAQGVGGFAVLAEAPGERAGFALAGLGDVNNDGRDDFAVGAYDGGPDGQGRVYVVFGRGGGAPVDLAAVAGGQGGFAITGEAAGDRAGVYVARVGDLNLDGLADLAIGASRQGADNAGAVYVVFGKIGGAPIDLAAIAAGEGGFRIDGAEAGGVAGRSVAAAGDVNADGRPDLLIGAYLADGPGGVDSGTAYVVFGQESWFAL